MRKAWEMGNTPAKKRDATGDLGYSQRLDLPHNQPNKQT